MASLSDAEIVDRVVARLQGNVPGESLARVEDVVAAVLAHYDDSTVRDFLPVLVERDAREVLRGTSDDDAA